MLEVLDRLLCGLDEALEIRPPDARHQLGRHDV